MHIKAVHGKSDETYGAIRVHRDLRADGQVCSKNRIARLMQLHGLRSVHRRKYRPQTTQSNHPHSLSANLIEQDFSAEAPNQKWGCDISYIPTAEGWLYLAIVMDFYSRKIVGYATSQSLHTSLCTDALQRACVRRRPPQQLIHHSDRGVQYASLHYRQVLQDNHFVQSMSRKGNCYDNAMVESFFHTLKVERVHRKRYLTRQEATTNIQNYIDGFYNPVRRHSALDYLSPNLYEQNNPIAA